MANACNVHVAVRFVAQHVIEAADVAKRLDIPTENLLGLAAHECQHGMGRFAVEGNSFFSMRSPAPLQSGSIVAKGDAKVKVASYGSFEIAAKSFELRYGNSVRGKRDPGEVSRALIAIGFNTGKSSNGGKDGYAMLVEEAIRMVKIRMECR